MTKFRYILFIMLLLQTVVTSAAKWNMQAGIDKNFILTTQIPITDKGVYNEVFSDAYTKGIRAFSLQFETVEIKEERFADDKYRKLYDDIFATVFTPVVQLLDENPDDLIFLFIENNRFPSMWLADYLKKSRLREMVVQHKGKEKWKSVAKLIKTGRRLFIFNSVPDEYQPDWILNKGEYFFTKSKTKEGYIDVGNPQNDFFEVDLSHEKKIKTVDQVTDSLISIWRTTARMPNFIVVDQSRYKVAQRALEYLHQYDYVDGVVSCNHQMLDAVHWKGLDVTTDGKFEILTSENDSITLEPMKDGFRFFPEQVSVTDERKSVQFEASGLSQDDGILLDVDFEDEFTDKTSHINQFYLFGPSLIEEDTRGGVVVFSPKDIMQIDFSPVFNNVADFSFSLWFKIDHYPENDVNIGELRGNRSVEFILRNRRLMMLSGGEVVESPQTLNYSWNHVVATCSRTTGKLNLFLNGAHVGDIEVGKQELRPDKLFLGNHKGIGLDGFLDNMKLWGRALSFAEVENFYQQEYERPDFESNLVAYYPFEGNVMDEGPGVKFNGKSQHIEFINDSIIGKAAWFNGSDSYVDCGNDPAFDITNVISISVWVKPSLLYDHISIVGKGFSYSAKIWEKYMLFTTTFISDHRSDKEVIELNKWQHLTYVFNAGGTLKFYKNGELVYETMASPLSSYSNSFFIGRNLWGQYFKGGMDELYVWNRELKHSEVRELYRKSRRGLSVFQEPEQPKYIGLTAIIWILVIVGVILLFIVMRQIKFRRNNKNKTLPEAVIEKPKKDYVHIFGAFKVVDKQGEDITARFTPKLRQLFLAILLYQHKNSKGITSKQLNELLWMGYSASSAKNIRSTSVQNLRALLVNMSGVEVVYENKYWRIAFQGDSTCDLVEFNELFKQLRAVMKSDSQAKQIYLRKVLSICQAGPVFPLLDYEWIDDFKGEITNNVLEVLGSFSGEEEHEFEQNLLLEMVSTTLIFDTVNEEAMQKKVKWLCEAGKSSVAQSAYRKFIKEYHTLYGEDYHQQFQDIIGE
ncbi:hypothetical protein EYV94_26120 [Puteibacter caeruleilacunae]|nr:hypothetical protein EYV94_26120 [Puteibacter caeruleilacunae]